MWFSPSHFRRLTNLESMLRISAAKVPSSSLNSKEVRLIGFVKIPQDDVSTGGCCYQEPWSVSQGVFPVHWTGSRVGTFRLYTWFLVWSTAEIKYWHGVFTPFILSLFSVKFCIIPYYFSRIFPFYQLWKCISCIIIHKFSCFLILTTFLFQYIIIPYRYMVLFSVHKTILV